MDKTPFQKPRVELVEKDWPDKDAAFDIVKLVGLPTGRHGLRGVLVGCGGGPRGGWQGSSCDHRAPGRPRRPAPAGVGARVPGGRRAAHGRRSGTATPPA